jgi:hypothetical protein
MFTTHPYQFTQNIKWFSMVKLCLKRKLSVVGVVLLLLIGSSSVAQITNPAMGNAPFRWVHPITTQGLSFSDMSFIDNNTGLAVSSGTFTFGGIMRTTDGGRNWQYVTFKFTTATAPNTVTLGGFNDVHFVTPTIAYAVGNSGLMVKSTDGGMNWTAINTPLTALAKNINALHFINKDTGYIGGQYRWAGIIDNSCYNRY